MTTRILGPRASRRRRRFLLAPIALVALVALVAISSASGVLAGSPSSFESGNDPTLGLGNMVINTTGNTDWVSVTGEPNYVHLTDAAATNSDDSFTPGQKQDTVCPTIEGHKNPPKDDFTDVASFFEVNTDEDSPNFGDVYLYGATIRYAPNGNASENIELKQGTSGTCADEPRLLERTPGDKMIAIDYLGGGSAVQFHVLTWVDSGPCAVANDPAPCWGASILELDPTDAEGGVNASPIAAGLSTNPISGVALKAGQFAEFGINLSDSGIIGADECAGFSQTIWESRSSGSSFVSSTKDISVEDNDINLCGSAQVTKFGSDEGSQEGAEFTLYEGADTTGDIVGTCTVNADKMRQRRRDDRVPAVVRRSAARHLHDRRDRDAGRLRRGSGSPGDLHRGDRGDGFAVVHRPASPGCLEVLKNSTKGDGTGRVTNAGAVFSYNTSSVTDTTEPW